MPISPEFIIDEETPIRERYWQPRAGDVCIDIGAFHGSYTLPALAAGAWVYAIDAREQPLKTLVSRAISYGLTLRLHTIHAAISNGEPYTAEHVEAIATGPAPSREMIPDAQWCTVDSLFNHGAVGAGVDWIKVDVEGGEVGVLEGARETLRRFSPRLLIEDHSRVYPWVSEQGTTERLLSLLADYGYTTTYISDTYPDYVVGWRA
jgi:FkbM family methyltransferase